MSVFRQIKKKFLNKTLPETYITKNDIFQLKTDFNKSLINLYEGIARCQPRKFLKFEVHIVDHCNLNCRGCGHFSPISSPVYLDLDQYKKDLLRIHKLFGINVRLINLMGGEPLLHSRLTDFFFITRKIFPDTNISLITNGLLLPNMSNSFWEAIEENDIQIEVTRYPIKFDYSFISELAKTKHARFCFFGSTKYTARTFNRLPLDLAGTQDEVLSYIMCYMANDCIALKNGKLYPCPVAAYAYKISHIHDIKFTNLNRDFIDIYAAESAEQIMEFLSRPIPFCRYCNVKKRTGGHPWRPSNKDISEWLM